MKSISDQAFGDYEVILVDDGSTDGSPALCDAWAADGRFRVIHQENAGVSAARNAGIEVARGEWVWFVDSDDWVKEGSLDTLARALKGADFDVLAFRVEMVDGSGRAVGEIGLPRLPEDPGDFSLECCEGSLYAVNFCTRRSAIGGQRFRTDVSLMEDRLFFYHLCARCAGGIGLLDESLYCYEVGRAGSATAGVSVEQRLRCVGVDLEILLAEAGRGRPFPAYSCYVRQAVGGIAAIYATGSREDLLPEFLDYLRAHGEYASGLSPFLRVARGLFLRSPHLARVASLCFAGYKSLRSLVTGVGLAGRKSNV